MQSNREANGSDSELIRTVNTSLSGHFSASIDNSDPEGGTRDIFIRARTTSARTNVIAPGTGDVFFVESSVHLDVPDDTRLQIDLDILEDDWIDWDVIHHESGHYFMDFLNIQVNPGGPHIQVLSARRCR